MAEPGTASAGHGRGSKPGSPVGGAPVPITAEPAEADDHAAARHGRDSQPGSPLGFKGGGGPS